MVSLPWSLFSIITIYMGAKDIEFSKLALKELKKIPKEIITEMDKWTAQVREHGVVKIREIQGYHDEALHPPLEGFRSIRLNRAYRLIYSVEDSVVLVKEIVKHRY